MYFPKFSMIAFYYHLVPVTNSKMRRCLNLLTGITVCFALITFFCDTFWCGANPAINWLVEVKGPYLIQINLPLLPAGT